MAGESRLSKQDKANIFGLNAAKIYGIDPKAKLTPIPGDEFAKLNRDALVELRWPNGLACLRCCR